MSISRLSDLKSDFQPLLEPSLRGLDIPVLPRASVRQPLLIPEPTNGSGSAQVWQACPPAMAAGLTEHVWMLKEVGLSRVPPWPQPQAV